MPYRNNSEKGIIERSDKQANKRKRNLITKIEEKVKHYQPLAVMSYYRDHLNQIVIELNLQRNVTS